MIIERLELECPRDQTPQKFVKNYMKQDNNSSTDEFILVKVTKLRPTNRAKTNFAPQDYHYLFQDKKLLLGNVGGLRWFFKGYSFGEIIKEALRNISWWKNHWSYWNQLKKHYRVFAVLFARLERGVIFVWMGTWRWSLQRPILLRMPL